MNRYFLFHKPYQVLSQFSREGDKKTLADYFPDLPKNVYPVGRLDYDSEGLLLLTDDKRMTHDLLDPGQGHKRTYLVQAEGLVSTQAIEALAQGVTINHNGKQYRTRKANVTKMEQAPELEDRVPPVRYRKEIPTSWLIIELTEGKNRQVRKMTAAVGFPTLRLIRTAIGKATLEGLSPGEYREESEAIRYKLLG